ncbi:MAG: hypothetical protein HUJ58_01140, partial [Erysipelotrichaceae bacterium]|nr:hypothetical protein [Erysipelotrichaceae bacterium]
MKRTISLFFTLLLLCAGCQQIPDETEPELSVSDKLEEAQYVRYVYCGNGSVNTVYLYQSGLRSFHIYCGDKIVSVGYRNRELSDDIVYVYGDSCFDEALYQDYRSTLQELEISEEDFLAFLKEMHEASVLPEPFLQFSEQFAQWDTEESKTVLTFEDAVFIAVYTDKLEVLRFYKDSTEVEIYPSFDTSG